VFNTTVTAHYKFNKRLGGLVGVTYFNAEDNIEDDTERTEIG